MAPPSSLSDMGRGHGCDGPMGPARPHTDPIAHTTPQCQTHEYLLHVCYGGLTYAHSFRSAELAKGCACASWGRALLPATTIGTRRRNSITTTTTTTNKQRFTGPKGRTALSCLSFESASLFDRRVRVPLSCVVFSNS